MRSEKGTDQQEQRLGEGKVQGQVQRTVKGSQKEAVLERQPGGPEKHGIQRDARTSVCGQ